MQSKTRSKLLILNCASVDPDNANSLQLCYNMWFDNTNKRLPISDKLNDKFNHFYMFMNMTDSYSDRISA